MLVHAMRQREMALQSVAVRARALRLCQIRASMAECNSPVPRADHRGSHRIRPRMDLLLQPLGLLQTRALRRPDRRVLAPRPQTRSRMAARRIPPARLLQAAALVKWQAPAT